MARAHPRGGDRQQPAASTPPGGLRGLKAQIKLTRPAISQLRVVISRADALDVPRSRRDKCTICTAAAPDLVFTARGCGDTASLHGPRLVCKSAQPNPGN